MPRVYDRDYNEVKKNTVKEYLKGNSVGRNNAIRYRDSKPLFGMHDRQLALIIVDLRNEGYPICANNRDGIWWAKDKEELIETINVINSRIGVMSTCVDGLKRSLENFDLQFGA